MRPKGGAKSHRSAMSNFVETSTVRMTLEDDGIIVVTALNDLEQTAAHAAENCRAGLALAAGRPSAVLISDTTQRVPSRAAQRVYVDTVWSTAMAIVVDSVFARVTAHFFIRVGRPNWPVRAFDSEDEARQWLRQILARANDESR